MAGLACSVLLGVGLALLLIYRLNARLRPVLLAAAEAQTANRITAAINDAAAAQAVSYTDLVTLERDAAGNIIALTSNMAQANVLRAQLLDAALEAVNGLEYHELEIPLGTLMDLDLLSGRGPSLTVKVVSAGEAHAEFENVFTSAGINQTRHQIFFHITAQVAILLPGETCRSTVSLQVCVAETVIVGKVPDTYLQLGDIA